MQKDLIKLSKTLSHALRHAPEEYGFALDEYGWVSIETLLKNLEQRNPAWSQVTEQDLIELNLAASKQRFEIKNHRIRAFYGHSTPEKLRKTAVKPPDILYHGTAPEIVEKILQEGLKPMRRHHVHLSIDLETAGIVGLRKSKAPVILKVDAKQAYLDGIHFYHGNTDIWLADFIAGRYIEKN